MSCLVSPLGLSLNGKVPVLKYPPALLRAYTLYIVCKLPSLLHRWGRGVENQGDRGEEAKVKEKGEDIEVKSKVVKGIRPLRGVFLWVVKAVKAKNGDYSVMRARVREKTWIE